MFRRPKTRTRRTRSSFEALTLDPEDVVDRLTFSMSGVPASSSGETAEPVNATTHHQGRRDPDLRFESDYDQDPEGGGRDYHCDRQGEPWHDETAASNADGATLTIHGRPLPAFRLRRIHGHRRDNPVVGDSDHHHHALVGNDENRDEDTITLSAYSGTAGNSKPEDTIVTINVEDMPTRCLRSR